MKRFFTVFSAAVLAAGLLLTLFPAEGAAAGFRTVKVQLVSSSKVAWGMLYIDGRYMGRVYREQSRTFRLRSGVSHRFRMTRNWQGVSYNRNKSEYIPDGDGTKWVFLAPIASGGSDDGDAGYTTVRCKLTSTARIAWGRLYINGTYRGRVSRDSYLSVRLRSNRTYRFEVRRYWNGENFYRGKSEFVGGSDKTVFLHPMPR